MDLLNSNNTSLHEIILNDNLYVNKAEQLLNFMAYLDTMPRLSSPNINLLIRPRGFGLSLMVDAIEAILSRDDLISDHFLARYKKINIPQCPVIKLSLNKINTKNVNEFRAALNEMIQMQMWEHHLKHNVSNFQSSKFAFLKLIEELSQKHNQSIVILIDNYDVPFYMVQNLDEKSKNTCISIYLNTLNAIKQAKSHVRWCLLSGHIKYSLSSLQAEGLPLINDLSYSHICDTLLGFTLKDIKRTFKTYLKRYAPRQGVTVAEFLAALDHYYGGFCFSDRSEYVLNSHSVTSCFNNEGIFLPYLANIDFDYLKNLLSDLSFDDFNWLFNKDGQDPLFFKDVNINPNIKDIGTILIQQGFLSTRKITRTDADNYITYRYKFNTTNGEMLRLLKVFLGQASKELLKRECNAQVYYDGLCDYDL